MMRTLDKQMFDDDKEEDDKCGKCYPTMCCCEDRNVYEWTWDENFASNISELSDRNLLVRFHPGFSNGTAAIKGNKLMEKGRHHYWEVKMLTQVYGTDVMVGVGTTKVDLNCRRNTFCSLLGCDRESWGFSYKGYLQHNGKIQDYSAPFEKGSLVGAHLDTWRGTLEFYLNRKPLGIAFTGLRDVELYPMICSTAAQSRIKLTYSNSMDASLQMDCLARLKPLHRAYLVAAFPGLRYLSKSVFADILQKRFDENYEEEEDLELPAEFMILDDFDFALVGLGRKRRKKHLERTEFDDLVPKRMLHFSP